MGPERRAGVPPSPSSMQNGTQFNNRFDPATQRLSESSSDQSEVPADPLRDTPRMEPGNVGSSPASSMESLPPATVKISLPRPPQRSVEERMYNTGPAPPHATFSAPSYQEHLHPSVLVPVNPQPIPLRRDGSPPRHGPRTAPWSGVPVSVSEYNQDLRTSVPTPPSSSSGRHPPPIVNYPVHPTAPRPQQFGAALYPAGINDSQSARGPVPSAPYDQPRRSDERKIHRKNVPSSSSSGLSPPSGVASAAARSAFQQPATPPKSLSLSPPKSRYPPPGSRPLTSQRT